jgi:hypothetical protein
MDVEVVQCGIIFLPVLWNLYAEVKGIGGVYIELEVECILGPLTHNFLISTPLFFVVL